MPSTYSTSNTNYVISFPSTQEQKLAQYQEKIPQRSVDIPPLTYYAPSRNIHSYSVMSHEEETD